MENERTEKEMIADLNQLYKHLALLREKEADISREIIEIRERINSVESEISQAMIEKRRVE